ncbi:MAG: hypothetical protein AAFN50_15415 [Pseudomonadota bacterium]
MSRQHCTWAEWADIFRERSDRPLPPLEVDRDYSELPDSLARSLAIFQLGESGGGTVISQASRSGLPNLDKHYGEAMAWFVAEEHRHANLLAMCVRLLGGELIKDNWTAKLFVFGRRLIGLRLKVIVLLAAEVVGLVYYNLLARNLKPCSLRTRLLEIVEDERSHLYFHCDFLRSQVTNRFKKAVFVATWRIVIGCASVVVAFDHRHALRDLGIEYKTVFERWWNFARLAEALVVSDSPEDCAKLTIQAFVPRT